MTATGDPAVGTFTLYMGLDNNLYLMDSDCIPHPVGASVSAVATKFKLS